MKVPATRKPLHPSKKPSTLLGFLLMGVVAVSLGFMAWQFARARNRDPASPPGFFGLD